ncbi:MAG: hypothetical protein Q618_VCMC00001G1199 [Varibaculum cambriense DORA_20]|uniref:hypothetical protein n=1 Tax=Varibaculum cambriense TaxID=184870 RepID=UPI0003D5F06A|nr:hypothetical protein [Varibaculum cambriense]ETI83618.1 MAG: hypothetical protein Q618_VCMC00001G1199 [Varibaculum cambriense DORA_20]
MKVLKRVGLLTIVLLSALFASFTVSGNIAHAEEPPTISDHVYDPGDKLGGQAGKVKERLASLDRSGLHVYVAFPSEYSNETVSNWNLMALQKSGAPQGSYMLSIVADNPNQTMYLASADNAAKLSQEELSAIASEKMVPLLNQQKYPEAVLAYLDALSAKAPEMGSGLAVAPWAMIAFLVALIVVIIVISRVLRARRKAQNRTEDNASGESTEALASQDSRSQLPAFAVGTRQGGVTESEASTSKESSKTAVVDEDDHEDEQPSKGKFRLRFGRNDKSSGKSKSGKTPVDNPDTAKAVSENFAGAASSQPAAAALLQTPSTDAGLVNKEPNLTSVAGTAQVKAEEPNPAIPTGVPGTLNTSSSGKVPSLAELDQIALARTRAQTTNSTEAKAGYQVSPAPQMQAPTSSQLPLQSEEPALPQAPAPAPALSGEEPALSPQAAPLQPVQPGAAAQETRPGTFAPESTGLPATGPAQVSATTPRSNAPYTSLGASSPLAPATGTSSAPQRHDSVLRPGETTYLPPQANDDDTQVTSAAQIKDYGQERRDEIARAKARAQAADRFREEQARKQASATAQTAQPAHAAQPQISPLSASVSHEGQAAPPFASPLPPQAVASPVTPAVPQNAVPDKGNASRPHLGSQAATHAAYSPAVTSRTSDDFARQAPDSAAASAHQRGQSRMPTLPKMAPAVNNLTARSLPPVSPQAIPQVSRQVPGQVSQQTPGQAPAMANGPALSPAPSQVAAQPVRVARQSVKPSPTPQETAHQEEARPAPDFTKVLRQADSWARKGASKLTLAQQRAGKTVTQPFALALVRAQDSVRAAFAEFATAQLQSRPIDQQIVAGNLPGPLRELRDQITHFTNLYHQQTPLNEILLRFEREIVTCREDLVRCRLIVERIQNVDPQKATRIGNDVMGAHKLLSRAQNLIEDAKARDRAGQENEVLKATVRTENLLLQAQKIARQAHAEEAALRAGAKVEAALTFAEKVEPLSEQVAILMAAVDDYIGVHTAKVGVAARTMLDLANRTLTRLDQPGNHDPQEALRLLQRAQQQTEQALRLAENDVAKRS